MQRLARPGYLLCMTFIILMHTHAAVARAEQDAISPPTDPHQGATAESIARERRRDLGIGIRTGVSFAQFIGSDAPSTVFEHSEKPFITVGFAGLVGVHEWLSIQPELLFMSKGRRDSSNGAPTGTFCNDYIEIPILARVTVPITEQVKVYAFAGPALGFLLRFQLESEVDGTITDRTDQAKRLDLSGIAGLGIQVALTGPHGLVLEGRYDRSFTRFLKTEEDIKNRAFAFMLGYQYSFHPAAP
jgi:hypothetical protein